MKGGLRIFALSSVLAGGWTWSLMAAPDGGQSAASETRDVLPVDHTFDVSARVKGNGATASLVEKDGRLLLQLAFAPGPNKYPGVFLPVPGGKLNLEGYGKVEFQVANTGGAAIRIGCRVSDGSTADGHKHCNTEMATLAPGEAKSVMVTFGRSYGGPGWDLDAANIVCLELQAEDPKGATTVAVKGIVAHAGKRTRKLRLAADATWQPIEHYLVPEKGSALDFSFLLDAPAGKHGPVVIRNGRMEYRDKPGQHARFYGANVVYGANFPDKATAEIMADQLARNGYNSLRFHHFDQLLLDKKAADSLTFDPAQLDKLDYFFACLKARGIYLTIDLYSARETRPNEIPELGGKKASDATFKSAIYILESARKNWEEYTRRLLTHVNPYTKMAWKDDPALFALALVNEGQVYQTWQANKSLYQQRFEEVSQASAPPQSEDRKAAAWNWFLTDIQRRWMKQGTAFVRGLGCDALITDANYIPMRPLAVFRTDLDVVDIHCYWDGPQALSGWGAPLRCNQGNPAKDGGTHMPLYSAAGRLLGKPFMITEYNIGYPNKFRAACGPLVGAYSAFQDFDAVYRFDHIGVAQSKPGPIIWFSSANDPMALLGERLGAAMFLRQDIRPADTVVPYLVTDDYLNQPKALDWSHWYDDSYIGMGMSHRIGTVVLQKNEKLAFPTTILVSKETVLPERLGGATVFSPHDSGKIANFMKASRLADGAAQPAQIRFDRNKGTFRLVSARTECLFVTDKDARLDGTFLHVENAECHATVGAVSLDGKPLAESRRILILHLTDVLNAGEVYRDESMSVLETYGAGGLLVRKGVARLALSGKGAGAKLFALDLAGKRQGEVALENTAGGVAFTAQTHRGSGTCLAYELIR